MLVQDFVEKFAACFHKTDMATILPTTIYKQLDEWGSMLTLIVIAMIDADYDKIITSEDLKSTDTVEQLFELVKNK